jgi:hypothetical protein
VVSLMKEEPIFSSSLFPSSKWRMRRGETMLVPASEFHLSSQMSMCTCFFHFVSFSPS